MSEPIKVYHATNGEPLILSSPSYARELLASGDYVAEPPLGVVTSEETSEETGGETSEETGGETSEEPTEPTLTQALISEDLTVSAVLLPPEQSTEEPPTEEPTTEPTEETPTDGPTDSGPAASGGNRRRNRRDTQPAS